MSDLFEQIREANSELHKAASKDLAKWSKLKHIKEDFELFLQFNIAEIEYRTLKGEDASVICTSNTALIKILDANTKEDKQKLVKFHGSAIKSKDPKSVLTWDLVNNRYTTIPLNSWQIRWQDGKPNLISISPENILILDELITKILKA